MSSETPPLKEPSSTYVNAPQQPPQLGCLQKVLLFAPPVFALISLILDAIATGKENTWGKHTVDNLNATATGCDGAAIASSVANYCLLPTPTSRNQVLYYLALASLGIAFTVNFTSNFISNKNTDNDLTIASATFDGLYLALMKIRENAGEHDLDLG